MRSTIRKVYFTASRVDVYLRILLHVSVLLIYYTYYFCFRFWFFTVPSHIVNFRNDKLVRWALNLLPITYNSLTLCIIVWNCCDHARLCTVLKSLRGPIIFFRNLFSYFYPVRFCRFL